MMQTDKEYAQALFSLALEENKANEYLQDLEIVQNIIEENPDYIEFLASPAIPLSDRIKAIDEAFEKDFDEYLVSFFKLLCENGKIRVLCGCINEFHNLAMDFFNKCSANIYSAITLDEKQKEAVCFKLKKLVGKQIKPKYIIDDSLIGGLKIEIDGKTYDGSIKHRLQDVKEVIGI